MKTIVAVAAILFCANSARAEWSFVSKVDEFTDKQVRFAVYEDSEHRIQLSHQGESVWMFITRKKTGTFDPNGLVEMRIDKNTPRTMNSAKDRQFDRAMGKKTFQWEPATIGFLLWHGKESQGCGYVSELLQGQELKVRYQVNSMQTDVLSANLIGAKDAIISGLSLTTCGK